MGDSLVVAEMWHGMTTGGAVHQLFSKQAYLAKGNSISTT